MAESHGDGDERIQTRKDLEEEIDSLMKNDEGLESQERDEKLNLALIKFSRTWTFDNQKRFKPKCCAMCHEEKKLCQSHIIPKAIMTKMQGDNPSLISLVALEKTSDESQNLEAKHLQSPTELAIPLLCESCEGKLATWEKVFCDAFQSIYDQDWNDGKEIESTILHKFFASIVYRGLFYPEVYKSFDESGEQKTVLDFMEPLRKFLLDDNAESHPECIETFCFVAKKEYDDKSLQLTVNNAVDISITSDASCMLGHFGCLFFGADLGEKKDGSRFEGCFEASGNSIIIKPLQDRNLPYIFAKYMSEKILHVSGKTLGKKTETRICKQKKKNEPSPDQIMFAKQYNFQQASKDSISALSSLGFCAQPITTFPVFPSKAKEVLPYKVVNRSGYLTEEIFVCSWPLDDDDREDDFYGYCTIHRLCYDQDKGKKYPLVSVIMWKCCIIRGSESLHYLKAIPTESYSRHSVKIAWTLIKTLHEDTDNSGSREHLTFYELPEHFKREIPKAILAISASAEQVKEHGDKASALSGAWEH